MDVLPFFPDGGNFCEFLFASVDAKTLLKKDLGTLKGKDRLLDEQMLSCTSQPPLRREPNLKIAGLLPLKVYLFISTLKAPITTAADDIHQYFFIVFFRENNT